MTTFTLSNGLNIPAVGLGTFLMTPEQAEKAVIDALKAGYRMIDTANAYMNEKAVGRGMKKSGVARKDIFLCTKLWPSEYEKLDAVDKSLELLDTDYIDLLFIHQPSGNYMAGYRLLEKAYKEGKIKSIGISNFHDESLEKLLTECEIKPHVIQYEAHPYYTADAVMDVLKEHGTKLMAWYPLGHGDAGLLNEPIFAELAGKYNKTSVQIVLKWHIQFGNIVIPGSTNPEHIKENADIFDFELTAEEMEEIAKLNKNTKFFNTTPEREAGYVNFAIDLDAQV